MAAAELKSEDVVLEIGAGIGNLTERLARKAKKVIAIELDPALVNILHDRFDNVGNIEIIAGDALKVDFPEFDKVVSNLPYSISSEITFKLLRHKFKLGILMYQYEFAATHGLPAQLQGLFPPDCRYLLFCRCLHSNESPKRSLPASTGS